MVSDWPGWWNVYQVGLVGEPAQALFPAEEEFAEPLWQLGGRPFAVLGDGRLAVLHGSGGMRLGLLDPETAEMTDPDIGSRSSSVACPRTATRSWGWQGARDPAVRHPDRRGDRGDRRCCAGRPRKCPTPPTCRYRDQVLLDGQFGRNVHALVYPPSHPEAVAPEGELPPYSCWAHGGPTSHAVGLFDLEKAYFTSRGIGSSM